MRFFCTLLTALSLYLCLVATPALAQSASCTTVASGTSQDITAFSVCKKVTFAGLSGAASVCAVTGTTAAEWQSFYDNPPAGVTIGACSGGCSGFSYGGYCYYYSGDASPNSCDTTCASQGGCNAAGTRYIGSDDSSASRCSSVAAVLSANMPTVSAQTGNASGCSMNTLKGGWIAYDYYSPTTTCADTTVAGRICACNGSGGSAPCNLPWGGTIAHNASVTAYAAAAGTPTCTSETRTCTNGVLSGSYTSSGCTAGCALPWGSYIASGASTTAYQVASGPSCPSQTRTCTAGSLSGSYTFQSCSISGGCSGYSYLGYCYYASGNGQSCDTACSTHGGCVLAGLTRISTGASNAECQNAIDTLGLYYDLAVSTAATTNGCYTQLGARSQIRAHRSTSAPTCASLTASVIRVCSCTN